MSNSGEPPAGYPDPPVLLMNLSTVRERMDSLQQFLSESVSNNTLISEDQMGMVSAEISNAIQQIIVNGAALLACCQPANNKPSSDRPPDLKPQKKIINQSAYNSSDQKRKFSLKEEEEREDLDMDLSCDIVEMDAVELLAEHVHFCEICGKGFKRDANLRMHMRAHGNQFKTPEALAKPAAEKGDESLATEGKKTRFSCPFEGCNRNKKHSKFKPLKSVICVRNHFKRSHCPKMYSCNRCNKKSFSVMADLKSHLKNCGGESRWKCSCGTTFSRKDKLFGHMALFEGHMPAVVGVGEVDDEDNKVKNGIAAVEEDEENGDGNGEQLIGNNCMDNGLFEELLIDGFGSIDGYNLQDALGSPSDNFCGIWHS